jgi:hypothetical protein
MTFWQPWKNAPRDGRWFIARSNDKVSLYRVSWGVDRKGIVGWCGPDKSYGDGLFEPFGGWIDWPGDAVQPTHQQNGGEK